MWKHKKREWDMIMKRRQLCFNGQSATKNILFPVAFSISVHWTSLHPTLGLGLSPYSVLQHCKDQEEAQIQEEPKGGD